METDLYFSILVTIVSFIVIMVILVTSIIDIIDEFQIGKLSTSFIVSHLTLNLFTFICLSSATYAAWIPYLNR